MLEIQHRAKYTRSLPSWNIKSADRGLSKLFYLKAMKIVHMVMRWKVTVGAARVVRVTFEWIP